MLDLVQALPHGQGELSVVHFLGDKHVLVDVMKELLTHGQGLLKELLRLLLLVQTLVR